MTSLCAGTIGTLAHLTSQLFFAAASAVAMPPLNFTVTNVRGEVRFAPQQTGQTRPTGRCDETARVDFGAHSQNTWAKITTASQKQRPIRKRRNSGEDIQCRLHAERCSRLRRRRLPS
jgi:hypothetical protein